MEPTSIEDAGIEDASAGQAGARERDALVTIPDGVLLQHVADETVLLELDSGTYFTLDPVGTRMLDLSCELPDMVSVVEVLFGEYQATVEQLSRDLESLLRELESQSLVVRRR